MEQTIHEMTLRESPFRAVEAGRKTIEMRLFDEKRRRIRAGDRIRFRLDGGNESILVRVEQIHYFPTFGDLYAALIPTHGKAALGYRREEIPDPADMLDYYPASQIARHGVVGIEITLKEGSPS